MLTKDSMPYDEALALVLEKADDWAGEYGFVVPEEAKKVFEAITVIEERTRHDNRN